MVSIKARPTNKELIKKRFPQAYSWMQKYDIWRDDYDVSFGKATSPNFNVKKNLMTIPATTGKGADHVLIHEMGHVWQKNDPRILSLEKVYLSKVARYAGQDASMHDIQRDRIIQKLFFKRKPISEYLGRVYSHNENNKDDMGYVRFPHLKDVDTTEVLTVGLEYAYKKGMSWLRDEDPLLALLLEHIFPKLESA